MDLAGLSLAVALGCVAITFVGATVQGSLGFGLGMVSTPVLALADPHFVPGAIIIVVLPLSFGVVRRDIAHVDWRAAGVALAGRLPGVALGSVAAAVWTDKAIAIGVAISVLTAVVVTGSGVTLRPNRPTLVAAGALSGFMGTTTGVGGPPMALTYQDQDPVVMRATLAAFFTAGTIMSAVGLIAADELGHREWSLAALLTPAVLAGLIVSRWTNRHLNAAVARPMVLGISALSAVALLIRTLA